MPMFYRLHQLSIGSWLLDGELRARARDDGPILCGVPLHEVEGGTRFAYRPIGDRGRVGVVHWVDNHSDETLVRADLKK